MKKSMVFIIIVIAVLLTGYSSSFAASYFTNNKALDSTFKNLEKEFLKYKRDEVIPLKNGSVIVDKSPKNIKRTTKKMSDSQIEEVVQKSLNDIKVSIETKEEELGGFSQQEYKMIADEIAGKLFFAQKSEFFWDTKGKTISLGFSLSADEDWVSFKGIKGNFARMGKEKDQVSETDLQVKDKITEYLNQSIQKGNKVSSQVREQLPAAVEKLFTDRGLSRIVAGRMLAQIHQDIYTPYVGDSDENQYDGSQSIEGLIESYGRSIDSLQDTREGEKKLDYYRYPSDVPSDKVKDLITERIVKGELPEDFEQGFQNAVTLDELAKLYFESTDDDTDTDKNIVIEDSSIPADSPDYIKKAYIYGMIDNTDNLKKPMTRLEAARILMGTSIYSDWSDSLRVTDCNKIPLADQIAVGTCLKAGMKTRIDKFAPLEKYTKEEAIIDREHFGFYNIRNYAIPISTWKASKVTVGKNTIKLSFKDESEIESFIEECFEDTALEKIELTGNYMRIDTGGVLIEIFTPGNGVKFTVKNGVKFIDLKEGHYGPRLSYTIEPKILKASEKVDMNMQEDSVTKKLNAKLDAVLAKILKSGMSQEQKVKAIHDYIVLHVTYDSNYSDDQSMGSVITAIDKGKGVCGDYSLLFFDLCKRASIPCVFEAGDPFTVNHAWNAVFINGEWKFVDTTWDDRDNGKILYTYFLKDRFTFMKDHTPFMGTPDPDYYSDSDINPMKIKNQDELRAYLLKNFYWTDGFKLTFKLADKKMKPSIGYLNDYYVNIILTYDSKSNLYTVTAKAKN